jgi:hypothetical protein
VQSAEMTRTRLSCRSSRCLSIIQIIDVQKYEVQCMHVV